MSIAETGARHRSTEEYRRWLANECVTLEAQMLNTRKALEDLNVELSIAQKKQKSFTSMIENLKAEIDRLEAELKPLRTLQAHSDNISADIARKIQSLEVSIAETGARHRSTEEYRRWLANECVTLEAQMLNTRKALEDLNVELSIAQKKQKSFTSMIENLKTEIDRLEAELKPLRTLQANSDNISADIARKIQSLEQQKALVEDKLADKEKKLSETNQLLDTLRKDKEEIEKQASELEDKANQSELSWAHNMSYHLNGVMLDTFLGAQHELSSQWRDARHHGT